jgi:hypothetical protein
VTLTQSGSCHRGQIEPEVDVSIPHPSGATHRASVTICCQPVPNGGNHRLSRVVVVGANILARDVGAPGAIVLLRAEKDTGFEMPIEAA